MVSRFVQIKQGSLGCLLPELQLLSNDEGLHGLSLDQRRDDASQHLDGAVQLDGKTAVVAQRLVVLGRWSHVDDDEGNTMNCHRQCNVVSDPIHANQCVWIKPTQLLPDGKEPCSNLRMRTS